MRSRSTHQDDAAPLDVFAWAYTADRAKAVISRFTDNTENTFPTVDMNVFITQAEKRTYNKVQIPDLTDKHFNRLKASIAPLIGHQPT